MQEIHEDFVNWLRCNLSITYWRFDDDEKLEIVPKHLEHGYLHSNFNIDESIYRYYHLPTSNLLTDEEYRQYVKTGYVGNIKIALSPFSFLAYGAYHNRAALYTKLSLATLNHVRPHPYLIGGKKIKYLEDLKPYFKEYAKGFKDGFDNFYDAEIIPYLIPQADKQEGINKVFEFITKRLFFRHDWRSHWGGFITNHRGEVIYAFKDGQKQGYFYRAWCIVFSNSILFAPLFQSLSEQLENTAATQQGKIESSISHQSSKPKKQKPQTLLEIWTTGEQHYNSVIDFLKDVSPTIGFAFINDNLQWQNFDNNITYLAAFTQVCIKNNWIHNIHSAPTYKTVYKNTFNIEFQENPFKPQGLAKDLSAYTDAFANMPQPTQIT